MEIKNDKIREKNIKTYNKNSNGIGATEFLS